MKILTSKEAKAAMAIGLCTINSLDGVIWSKKPIWQEGDKYVSQTPNDRGNWDCTVFIKQMFKDNYKFKIVPKDYRPQDDE